MAQSEADDAQSITRSRAELALAKQRRQTNIFLSVFGVMLLIGFVAFGNWQGWWTIGGTAEAAGACPVQVVTDPDLVSVNVINSTGRAGLGASVARELQKRDFVVLSIGNADAGKPVRAVALVRYGPSGKLAATTVSRMFPAKVVMDAVDRDSDEVDVLIGTKYKGMVSWAKAKKLIAPEPARPGCTPPPSPTPSSSSSSLVDSPDDDEG